MKLYRSGPAEDEQFIRDILYRVMSLSNESELTPDPAIRQRLRERLVNHSPARRKFRIFPANFLISVLKFRIPLYQAAMGAASLFVVMLYAGRTPAEGSGPDLNQQFVIQFADTTERSDTLNTAGSNKIGRNLKEDSLLARFMISIM